MTPEPKIPSTSPLLQPLRIGRLELPNRVVMAPMTTRMAAADGTVTDQLCAYYEARARGGVGLIILELASPHPSGSHRRAELGVHDDRFIDGLSRLVERLKRHGSRVGIQIGHAGAHARPDVTGYAAVGPSNVSHVVKEGDVRTVVPRALTKMEIDEIVGWHASCGERLKRAGFDLIEIQGGHDYLIAQFLSPLDNRRDDDYGGDLSNRARFGVDVLRAVRASVGDLPLSFRFSADEFAPGGFSKGDGLALAPLLVKAGADLLHVSGGSARSVPIPWLITSPMAYPAGLFVPLAADIHQVVAVPVAVANRLHDPALAERVLTDGAADLVTLGRALLADAEWVAKVRRNRADDIRPCIACNTCVDHLRSGGQVRCLVNSATGREGDVAPRPPSRQLRVVVVGGGPAGLTVATELGKRGHQVRLLDGDRDLGGRLKDIPRAPYFQVVETDERTFGSLISYLARAAAGAGVEVTNESPAHARAVLMLKPDLVVLADGARYPVPGMLGLLRIPGARWLASRPRMRKLFFKLLRPRSDRLPKQLRDAGITVELVGDRAGTRGVEAAIHGATVLGRRF